MEKIYCYKNYLWHIKKCLEFICCNECLTPCKLKCWLGTCHQKMTGEEFNTMIIMKKMVGRDAETD